LIITFELVGGNQTFFVVKFISIAYYYMFCFNGDLITTKKRIYSMGHFMEVKKTSTNKDRMDRL